MDDINFYDKFPGKKAFFQLFVVASLYIGDLLFNCGCTPVLSFSSALLFCSRIAAYLAAALSEIKRGLNETA